MIRGMVLALLVVGTAARAADQLVPGSRLGLKVDAAHAREKLSFQSKGVFTIPTPGSPDDPSQTGATLTLVNPGTNESFTFDLPSTHWTASGSGTSYRYRDSGPVASSTLLNPSALLRTSAISASVRRSTVAIPEAAARA